MNNSQFGDSFTSNNYDNNMNNDDFDANENDKLLN